MTDPNLEPDSLTPGSLMRTQAGDSEDASAYYGMHWATPHGHRLDILIDPISWPTGTDDYQKKLFCQLFDAALGAHDIALGAVSVLLCGDVEIRQLNHTHRGKDKATNVLSFPAGGADDTPFEQVDDDPHELLGDIAIAHETCVREAAENAIRARDHMAHLFLHGVLHLLGYDHENDDDADAMESLETTLLSAMGIADPYDDDGYIPEATA